MFCKPVEYVVDPPLSNDAALSQRLLEHLHDLLTADFTALDQTHHHSHVLHDHCVKLGRVGFRRNRRISSCSLSTSAIELRLLLFAGRRSVVRRAPLRRALLPVRLPAAERAAEVFSPAVAGMRHEENSAMQAAGEAAPKIGPVPHRRSQHEVIRKDQVAGFALAVPPRNECESFLNGYKRKPRVLDRMLRLVMLLALLDSARVIQGRARAFLIASRQASLSLHIRTQPSPAHL